MQIEKILENFGKYQISAGIKEKTVKTYAGAVLMANEYKPIESWDESTPIEYIGKLLKTHKIGTVESNKIRLKSFFKFFGKKHIADAFIVNSHAFDNPLKSEEIITVDDVNNLIDATDSIQNKALIAFLFESGGRISEVLNIKVSDITESEKGMIVSILQTKTGNSYRRNIYPFSQNYIRNLLDHREKGDFLFKLKPVSAQRMLRELGKKVNFQKPLTPHKFRHAQACDMVRRGYNETIIRNKMGWTASSNMIARYTHIDSTDVINATIEKMGGVIASQVIPDIKVIERQTVANTAAIIRKQEAEITDLKKMMEQQNKTMNVLSALMEKYLEKKE